MFQRWKRAKWLRGTCRDARLVRPFGMEQSTCQFIYSFTINYIASQSQPFCTLIWVILPCEMTQIIIPLQFNAEGVVPLIAQGWRQPTLGYACSEGNNAVGVVRFLRGMP